jgi:hypothetical protein
MFALECLESSKAIRNIQESIMISQTMFKLKLVMISRKILDLDFDFSIEL